MKNYAFKWVLQRITATIMIPLTFWFIYSAISLSKMGYDEINIFFKLVLLIWTIGIFYHLFNGCRKLYWSFGIGMDLKTVYRSGYIVIFLTVLSTALVWLIL